MKSIPKTSNEAARSSGARGAANSGTRKASNAHAAQRQGAKAAADKASNRRTSAGDRKTPSSK
jgi:hypothetical protein